MRTANVDTMLGQHFNPFKPEFTIVIFIHYKPRIAVAILDLQWMKMIWCGLKIKENCHEIGQPASWKLSL